MHSVDGFWDGIFISKTENNRVPRDCQKSGSKKILIASFGVRPSFSVLDISRMKRNSCDAGPARIERGKNERPHCGGVGP